MKCLSHPDKELIVHLENVRIIGLEAFRNKQLNNLEFPYELMEKAISIMLYYHDIGKSTSYFQEYLNSAINGTSYSHNDNLRKHSLISAVYAGYKTYLTLEPHDSALTLSLLSFCAVLKHHGNLEDIWDMVSISNSRWKVVKEQWSCLNFEAIDEKNPLDFIAAKSFIDDLEIQDIIEDTNKPILLYFTMNLFFSLLTYADKNEAAFGRSTKLKGFDKQLTQLVDTFKLQTFASGAGLSSLNSIRNKIYNECEKGIRNNRLLSINVPTGSGKTLTVVNLAFKMMAEDSSLTRVIYALPFTSIIDQSEKVLQNVFLASHLNPEDYLVVHHHLAEAKIKLNEDYMVGDSAQFIIENWDSFFILTTFWQLFHTLISSKNGQLRKFHNLTNSIIILDEVQTIHYEYWYLANRVLKELAEMFNCRIILLTATMPLIFSKKANEINSLVHKDKLKQYFHVFSRYKLFTINDLENMTIEQLAEMAQQHIDNEPDKSFLFVFNTIKSSIEFFELLKGHFPQEEMIYISSNILPIDRLMKIEKIKNNTNRKIVVSTQIIEAGVDIDLDIVYRDFAPLDSIIQTAGRCNRNNRDIRGEVYLYRLTDNKNRYYCNFVYSTAPLHATEEIFEDITEIDEKKMFDLIDLYYKKVKDIMSESKSQNILNYIKELEYTKIDEEFKIIMEEGIPNVLVFIEKNDKASEVLNTFYEILDIEDKWVKKSRFIEIRKDIFSYTLSLRLTKENASSLKNFKDLGNFKIITRDMVETYYSEDRGYTNEFNNFF